LLSTRREKLSQGGLRRALTLRRARTVDAQLNSELRSYFMELLTSGLLRGHSIKPLNLIVIGCSADVVTDNLGDVLSKYAKRLDRAKCDISQVGVQLVTVGDNKEETMRMSKLDNELHREKRVRVRTRTSLPVRPVFSWCCYRIWLIRLPIKVTQTSGLW
jgi:hypothetical protein